MIDTIFSSFYNPISQSDKGNPYDDANGYIPHKTPVIAILEHGEAFIGKGGESGESTTETGRQKKAPGVAEGGVAGEISVEQTDEEATAEIGCQCTQDKRMGA